MMVLPQDLSTGYIVKEIVKVIVLIQEYVIIIEDIISLPTFLSLSG